MHVVIVGCGRVGSRLAVTLANSGHTVAVVDRRPEAFGWLPDGFECQRVVGVGFDRDVLEQAGARGADALAAVTSGDNSNILVARVAREDFGVQRVVARIYDPRRAEIYQRLGIPTVASVQWATERVLRRLLPDSVAVEWTDPTSKVSMVERSVPPAWAGHTVGALERQGRGLRVAAVGRNGCLVPGAETILQEGDLIWVTVAASALGDVDTVLAERPAEARR